MDESKTKVDKDDKASEVGTDIDEEDFAKDIDTEMGVLPVRDAKASDKDGKVLEDRGVHIGTLLDGEEIWSKI